MKRMSIRKRLVIRHLLAQGMSQVAIARVVGCFITTVAKTKVRYPRAPRCRAEGALTIEERQEIARGLEERESLRAIARRLNRAPSTISREVKKQAGRSYRAWRGEDLAERACVRPKPRKLEENPKLVMAVERGLKARWSPEQIAARLKSEHPDEPEMHVSHETIYKALFIQTRGELRRELSRFLRSRRTVRRPRGHRVLNKMTDMELIAERPPEVEDRAIAGHWEGDCIMGAGNTSAIGTLVERKTRFVMLLHLPNGKTAEHVRDQLTKKIQRLPAALRKTLTVDQGREFAQHARFTLDTNMKVYFCDPHSPWQRGSNENTNGLLRQYFPKGERLDVYSEEHLDEVAHELNGRPRQTLNWRTPSEALNELLR